MSKHQIKEIYINGKKLILTQNEINKFVDESEYFQNMLKFEKDRDKEVVNIEVDISDDIILEQFMNLILKKYGNTYYLVNYCYDVYDLVNFFGMNKVDKLLQRIVMDAIDVGLFDDLLNEDDKIITAQGIVSLYYYINYNQEMDNNYFNEIFSNVYLSELFYDIIDEILELKDEIPGKDKFKILMIMYKNVYDETHFQKKIKARNIDLKKQISELKKLIINDNYYQNKKEEYVYNPYYHVDRFIRGY